LYIKGVRGRHQESGRPDVCPLTSATDCMEEKKQLRKFGLTSLAVDNATV